MAQAIDEPFASCTGTSARDPYLARATSPRIHPGRGGRSSGPRHPSLAGEIAADGVRLRARGADGDDARRSRFALMEAATTGLGGTPTPSDAQVGEGYLCRRRYEAARIAAIALGAARAQKQPVGAAARWLSAEIAGGSLDEPGAEADYRHAMALASEIGMRPLVAHCHLGLGKLYRHTGKSEQAQDHLRTATTMYREMDMTYWLRKAEEEMR